MNIREEALAGLARWRLAGDERISGLPLDVHVQDCDVHVLGIVDSHQQRKTVETILGGLCGVHEIITDSVIVRQV
jgi:osmotically-inducible protein OsmY